MWRCRASSTSSALCVFVGDRLDACHHRGVAADNVRGDTLLVRARVCALLRCACAVTWCVRLRDTDAPHVHIAVGSCGHRRLAARRRVGQIGRRGVVGRAAGVCMMHEHCTYHSLTCPRSAGRDDARVVHATRHARARRRRRDAFGAGAADGRRLVQLQV
jgi:hypothetical protein